MGMPHAAERWTADQVRALPDDGNRYELVSGVLVVTPAPRGIHQVAVLHLLRRLNSWLETN
ncbi:MAG: Uma2 family endonuclease, partial [Gemmatimonadota bacterium]